MDDVSTKNRRSGVIAVHGLCKSYGSHQAVRDLNFNVPEGSVVGFLGPNGAGKSTTMKIITGFMAPTKGSVQVGGYDVFEKPVEVKKQIGYLPEVPPLYTDMLVREYLVFAARLKGVPRAKVRANVDTAVEKTGLQSVQNRLIQNLSKGFKQRVGLAQALVSDPRILILDEPTAGLDPKQMVEVRKLVRELKGQHTVMLSTHILSEVQATCDEAIIINKGRIVAQGPINSLVDKPICRVRLEEREQDLSAKMASIQGVNRVDAKSDGEYWLQLVSKSVSTDQVLRGVLDLQMGIKLWDPDQLESAFISLVEDDEGMLAGSQEAEL